MARLILVWNLVVPIPAVILLGRGQWGLAIVLLGSAHWPWLWATLRPGCCWWGPVRSRTSSQNEVWLTIDDGPDPVDTPQILDLLDAHGAKVTFFLIGKKAAAHPELVREIVRRGHEVANHTMNHWAGSFWIRGPVAVRQEILNATAVLSPLMEGQRLRWFRSPAGLRNHWVHPVLAETGLKLVAWSSRGYDGVSADADAVVNRVVGTLSAGAIVLLHEGRISSTGDRLILNVLPRVLREIEARGWRCSIPQ